MKKDEIEKVVGHIDGLRDDLVEFHRAMVETPSAHPSPDYTGIQKVMAGMMESIGLEVNYIGKPKKENILGRLRGTGKPTLLYFSHMDTVPAGDLSKWETHPFKAEMKQGRIYGLGASDARGGLAPMVFAAKAIKELGIRLTGDLVLVSEVDEEIGGQDGLRYLLAETGALQGADMALFCAMVSWNIPVVMRGILTLKLKTYGIPRHPADSPTLTPALPSGTQIINANHNMIKALQEILDVDRWMTYKIHDRFPLVGAWTNKPIVTASIIHGGIKSNIVPAYCEAVLDMRLLPGQSSSMVIKELEDLIRRIDILPVEGHEKVEVELESVAEPLEIPIDSPIIRAARETTEVVIGRSPQLIGFPSSAEACHLAAAGIENIKYGPEGGPVHQPNEYVEVDEMVKAAKAYAIMAIKLLS